MSVCAGVAMHVFQEMTWTNVDTLIDAFHCVYGRAPQEMYVSEDGRRKLEAGLHDLLPFSEISEISEYRGVTVKTQETFSPDTIELIAFKDKMNEQNLPTNTLRNADGTAFQAGYDESKTLEELVFTALGEASMCWSERPKGVFDDVKAKQIGEELCNAIRKLY